MALDPLDQLYSGFMLPGALEEWRKKRGFSGIPDKEEQKRRILTGQSVAGIEAAKPRLQSDLERAEAQASTEGKGQHIFSFLGDLMSTSAGVHNLKEARAAQLEMEEQAKTAAADQAALLGLENARKYQNELATLKFNAEEEAAKRAAENAAARMLSPEKMADLQGKLAAEVGPIEDLGQQFEHTKTWAQKYGVADGYETEEGMQIADEFIPSEMLDFIVKRGYNRAVAAELEGGALHIKGEIEDENELFAEISMSEEDYRSWLRASSTTEAQRELATLIAGLVNRRTIQLTGLEASIPVLTKVMQELGLGRHNSLSDFLKASDRLRVDMVEKLDDIKRDFTYADQPELMQHWAETYWDDGITMPREGNTYDSISKVEDFTQEKDGHSGYRERVRKGGQLRAAREMMEAAQDDIAAMDEIAAGKPRVKETVDKAYDEVESFPDKARNFGNTAADVKDIVTEEAKAKAAEVVDAAKPTIEKTRAAVSMLPSAISQLAQQAGDAIGSALPQATMALAPGDGGPPPPLPAAPNAPANPFQPPAGMGADPLVGAVVGGTPGDGPSYEPRQFSRQDEMKIAEAMVMMEAPRAVVVDELLKRGVIGRAP